MNIKEDKSSYRQIMKATSIFGGVQVFNIIISIIRSKVIAILLGPTGVGISSLLSSTTGLMSSLTNFGLGTSAIKDISEASASDDQERIAKVVAVFSRLVWITGSLGAVLTLIFAPWLSELNFGNRGYTWSFIFLSITLVLSQLTVQKNVILQGMRKIKYLASANMIGSAMSLILTLPLYYFYGVAGIVPGLLLISLVSFSAAFFFAKRVKIPKLSVTKEVVVKEGKNMIKFGFMLSLSGLITTLVSYLGRVYISNTGTLDDVGLYSAGFSIIGTYVGIVFTAMGTDYYPRLCSVANDNSTRNKLVNQQGEIAILILFPIILIFILFIPYIIQLLYSSKFLPINDMIVWAAFGMLFKAGSWAMAFQFLAKGSSNLFFLNELLINALMLISNIIGYNFFGLTGMGYSFLLVYVIYFLQVFFITKRYYDFSFHTDFLKIMLVAVLGCASCIVVALHTSGILKYSIGSLLIAGASIVSIYRLNYKTGVLSIIKSRKSN